MDKLTFAPLIDLPLAIVTLVAFVWHFNHWAFRNDIETSVDVQSRLPNARLRVIALFACVLLLCWILGFAFWLCYALLLGIGLAISLATGGDVDGGEFGLWATAFLIREWSFGFPELILHPEKHDPSNEQTDTRMLLGKTGVTTSSLRPTGDIDIDGVTYTASSADGMLLDVGERITVTSYRNGSPCVSLVTDLDDDGLPWDAPAPGLRAFSDG